MDFEEGDHMYPTHVALVPYQPGTPTTEQLLHVAAALQTQVSRDLAPLWGLSAVVSPFLKLEDVPPSYVTLAIVRELPWPYHGFHVIEDGRPLGLIGYPKGWPLLASHELMELLCDPWGNRSLPGQSLIAGQGQVEYLVEVCDPCQYGAYTINSVQVSDFVTPEYYGPLGSTGGRYSFTGSVTEALQILDGGLVSWRTPGGQTWQQCFGQAAQEIQPATSSRAFTHKYKDRTRPDAADKLPGGRSSPGSQYALDRSTRRYGETLKRSIDRILEQLEAKPPKANPDAIVRLLTELAKDGSQARTDYAANPEKTLKGFGLDPPTRVPRKLAPPDTYKGILAAYNGGLGLGDPKLAAWLSTHAAFMSAGIV